MEDDPVKTGGKMKCIKYVSTFFYVVAIPLF